MLIVCPSCASEYTIDPAKLGADGRTVRCALCRDTWFATPEGGAQPAPMQEAEATEIAGPPAEHLNEPSKAAKPARPKRSRKAQHPSRRPKNLAAGLLLFVAAAVATGVAIRAPEAPRQAVAALRMLVQKPPGGLGIDVLASEVSGPPGERVLRVSGTIVNPGPTPQAIPHLEFLVRSGDEQVLASWTSAPPRLDLNPGESVRFEERFPAPRDEGRTIRVQFARAGVAVAARAP